MFCHNPDSWDFNAGINMSADELLLKLDRFKSFLSSPGLTLSGGEPLAQPEFAREVLVKAKHTGWHTAIDTSGACNPDDFLRTVEIADILIMSIKYPTGKNKIYSADLTQSSFNTDLLLKVKIPVWIRYVVIPGWTDGDSAVKYLNDILKKIPMLQKVEFLPYNSLAENKWQELNIKNPLIDSKPKADEIIVERFRKKIQYQIRSD
jgi:pyruvate formate lyase activating enzyme